MDYKLRDATQHAEKLVRDENLQLPIDVIALAESRDIIVQAKPETAVGVSGMLINFKNNFAIGYATHIKNDGFQRFSIAHELGHYFLPGHPEQLFNNGQSEHLSRAGFGSGQQIELEADHFAAGLLMPTHLFKAQANKYSDGLSAIEKLAIDCGTSLTASAIRYAELTDAAIAVVLSTGAVINYCFASKSLRGVSGFKHPTKDSLLPKDSLTKIFNQTANNITSAEKDDDAADTMSWFKTDDEFEAYEEVIGLGNYGKTLTVITVVADED